MCVYRRIEGNAGHQPRVLEGACVPSLTQNWQHFPYTLKRLIKISSLAATYLVFLAYGGLGLSFGRRFPFGFCTCRVLLGAVKRVEILRAHQAGVTEFLGGFSGPGSGILQGEAERKTDSVGIRIDVIPSDVLGRNEFFSHCLKCPHRML